MGLLATPGTKGSRSAARTYSYMFLQAFVADRVNMLSRIYVYDFVYTKHSFKANKQAVLGIVIFNHNVLYGTKQSANLLTGSMFLADFQGESERQRKGLSRKPSWKLSRDEHMPSMLALNRHFVSSLLCVPQCPLHVRTLP